jgi:hypothetical protein
MISSSQTILEETEKYKEQFKKILAETEKAKMQYANKSPEKIRQNYQKLMDITDVTENNIRMNIQMIDKSLQNLEESKQILNNLQVLSGEIKTIFNKANIGTLEGLVREQIKAKNITTDNEFVNEVLSQPYDELKSMRERGGKRIKNDKTKRRRRKRLSKRKY